MEQLSQNAVRQLLAKARADATSQREGFMGQREGVAGLPRSWIDPAGQGGQGPSGSLQPAASGPDPSGFERRLVRRAELLWARLAEDAPMPVADRADDLLRPPFAAQGMMVEWPAGLSPSISFVGDALALLAGLSPGSAEDGALSTRLGTRLVGIARRAATLGEPCLYDSDQDRAAAQAQGADTQLLMRAIALPLSGVRNGGQGSTAVVIASWRKLLSAEETRALHRELAAAMDWMHRQGN